MHPLTWAGAHNQYYMDIRNIQVGNLGEYFTEIESLMLADREFQRGLDTMIEVVALKFDIESNQIVATTLQTDINGSSYVDININKYIK